MKNVLKILGILLALRVLFRVLGGRRRRRWVAGPGLGSGAFGQGGPVAIDGQVVGSRRQVPVA